MIDPFEFPDEVLDEICSPHFEDQLDDLTGYDEVFNGIEYPPAKISLQSARKAKSKSKKPKKNPEDYPSKYTEDYWIRAYAPTDSVKNNKLSGKWLAFCPENQIDAAWQQIKDATEQGLLGPSSKVSTKLGKQGNDFVICIYTKNWKNEKDVMRVRGELRELGFTKPMPYKSDEDTLRGKYASKGNKNISKYFE